MSLFDAITDAISEGVEAVSAGLKEALGVDEPAQSARESVDASGRYPQLPFHAALIANPGVFPDPPERLRIETFHGTNQQHHKKTGAKSWPAGLRKWQVTGDRLPRHISQQFAQVGHAAFDQARRGRQAAVHTGRNFLQLHAFQMTHVDRHPLMLGQLVNGRCDPQRPFALKIATG